MVYKTLPVLKDYVWGGEKMKSLFGRQNGDKVVAESWEVSVHPDGESRVEGGGTLRELLDANPKYISSLGGEFPLLIKYIDAKQKLSVQVHPCDEYARKVEKDNGKTEAWYIISADEGAGIYCGFKKSVNKEEFIAAAKDGSVENMLNFIPVKAGDCYLIPAGTVHAIGAGCLICEVQESSNVTYRVYDYNRTDKAGNKRPLHLDKAVEVINYSAFRDVTGSVKIEDCGADPMRPLTACEYFCLGELTLRGEYEVAAFGSFRALCVVEGSGEIDGKPFACGDSFFVPCGESAVLRGNAKIIVTSLPIAR